MGQNNNPINEDNNIETPKQRKRSAHDCFLIILGCPIILNIFYMGSEYIDVVIGGSIILIIANHLVLSLLSVFAVYGFQRFLKYVAFWPYWIFIGLVLCSSYLQFIQGSFKISDIPIRLFHLAVLLVTGFVIVKRYKGTKGE